MHSQSTIALVVIGSVSVGCLAGYVVMQAQVTEAWRLAAAFDGRRQETGMLVAQARSAGDEKPHEIAPVAEPRGALGMGPFTWSHFIAIAVFLLSAVSGVFVWRLGSKVDKADCADHRGQEGIQVAVLRKNQEWIIDAIQRLAANGGAGRTNLPDPPSHPNVDPAELD